MYKNKPKPETHQAILAQIKKEMNEPRIAESAREEDGNQTTRHLRIRPPQCATPIPTIATRSESVIRRREFPGRLFLQKRIQYSRQLGLPLRPCCAVGVCKLRELV
jgi:hypothetical protein